jgi:ubiquitin carboxyl-terminal hydrolase 4/11/15
VASEPTAQVSTQLGLHSKKHQELPSISLDECFALHCQEEELSEDNAWYCNVCRKHQTASKRLEIFRLPDVCVVHLKRFYFTANIREKIETFVSYPLDGWDLSGYELVKDPARSPPIYDLVGVVNHFGGLGGGHYTAYCRNKIDLGWYNFNDAHTSPMDPAQVLSPSAYLLFYRRRGSPDQPRPQVPSAFPSSHAASSNQPVNESKSSKKQGRKNSKSKK